MSKKITENSKRDSVRAIETDVGTSKDISKRLTAQQKKARKEPEALNIGDCVRLCENAYIYALDVRFPEECYQLNFYITAIKKDCAIISLEKHTGTSGSIAGAVNIKDLVKVNV